MTQTSEIPAELLDEMTHALWAEIDNRREWQWTFAEVQHVEPTNNTAECARRPAVIYRKLVFDTQNEAGSRFIERRLTVSETCRLQNKSVYQWVTAAVKANLYQ